MSVLGSGNVTQLQHCLQVQSTQQMEVVPPASVDTSPSGGSDASGGRSSSPTDNDLARRKELMGRPGYLRHLLRASTADPVRVLLSPTNSHRIACVRSGLVASDAWLCVNQEHHVGGPMESTFQNLSGRQRLHQPVFHRSIVHGNQQ